MSIVVIGSINTDLTIRVPHFAQCNETVLGTGDFITRQGGKGANQAVAAAAGGLPVQMIGKVGADTYGDAAIESLCAAGINCELVTREPGHSTGIATIFLDPEGNNSITVAPGANACVTAADVRAAESVIASASIVMLQLEIPLAAVNEAIEIARQSATPIVLDPAPATAALPDLRDVDYLTPNEIEAEKLTGIAMTTNGAPQEIAQELLSRGVRHVVLTLGKAGCYMASKKEASHIKARQVKTLDSTGAGDTFNGFLATALAKGVSFAEAVEIACAAASLSVTRSGARSNLPGWQEVMAFMR